MSAQDSLGSAAAGEDGARGAHAARVLHAGSDDSKTGKDEKDHKKKDHENGKSNGVHWRGFRSLDHEIGDIERSIRGGRAATTLHAAAVEQGLREKLSSPIALAVAAGAG